MSIYEKGFIDGVSAFAWWKDGKQHVGTTGRLLAEVKADPSACYGFDPPPEETEFLDLSNVGIPISELAKKDKEGITVELSDLSIGDLVELIEAARTVAKAKQSLLRADGGCSCHNSPPCFFCVEGGSLEIP